MKIIITLLLFFYITDSFSQQASYFDPAQMYNRLVIEKGNGTYQQIKNFRVTGTSFLYGEKNKGSMYASNESGNNILLTYDTYSQNVDFYPSSGTGPALTKEPGTLDSFVINKKPEAMLENDIKFVYGSIVGSKDKAYFQVVSKGKKVSLYKKYNAELGMVTTNYIQSELRQFNILVEYFYADSTGKIVKKLKISPKTLVKEFVLIKDLSAIINDDDLTANRENELIRLFEEMNRD